MPCIRIEDPLNLLQHPLQSQRLLCLLLAEALLARLPLHSLNQVLLDVAFTGRALIQVFQQRDVSCRCDTL